MAAAAATASGVAAASCAGAGAGAAACAPRPLDAPRQRSTVGIIGSTDFHDRSGRTRELTIALGHLLGQRPSADAGATQRVALSLVTGGTAGVPRVAAEAFADVSRVSHLLPTAATADLAARASAKTGTVERIGDDWHERRLVLAKRASVFVMVEGGPGAAEEGTAVLDAAGCVFPLISGGGAAAGLFRFDVKRAMERLHQRMAAAMDTDGTAMASELVRLLADAAAEPAAVARSIVDAVRAVLSADAELPVATVKAAAPDAGARDGKLAARGR